MDFAHTFLKDYLDYVEDTEPPRIFHVFSAISGVGAALGRRCWLPFGIGEIFPNNYILLVGPPATRKSTAVGIIKSLLKEGTNIKFGPNDTAGQRQGVISAMAGDIRNPDELKEDSALQQIMNNLQDPDLMGQISTIEGHPADAHAIYICASEFASFIGVHSREMISFLTKMWDGEDHEYKLKNELVWLSTPLLSILGGTTPTLIAECLPTTAIGGGFTSRNLLVYANKKYKNIPFPTNPPEKKRANLLNTLKMISEQLEGPFSIEPCAESALEQLYGYQVKIQDPRFVYYIERRFTHLIKICMAMAAMRGSMTIEIQDVEQAQLILSTSEDFMVDALGEYGLSALSLAKQKMLEFIEHSSPAPVPRATLMAVMQRDMKQVDLFNSLIDLCNANKIAEITTRYGPAYVYTDKNESIKNFVDDLLFESLKVEEANNEGIGRSLEPRPKPTTRPTPALRVPSKLTLNRGLGALKPR